MTVFFFRYVEIAYADLILEEYTKEDSEHKALVKECIDQGKLVPTETMVRRDRDHSRSR